MAILSMIVTFVWTFIVLLVAVPDPTYAKVNDGTVSVAQYTAYDDATWAVVSPKLSRKHRQDDYNAFMNECRASAGSQAYHYCDSDEAHRLRMNKNQPPSVSTLYVVVGDDCCQFVLC
jgi:hypothetical protein